MACRLHLAATFLRGQCLIRCLLRASLEERLTDTRKPRGKRHPLPSLVSVVVAGVASARGGPLAVAQAAAGWDQEVLAAHGCRVSPRTGLRVPPSASMLDRLGKLLDADELEAALSASVAAAALDPAIPAAYAAHRADEQRARRKKSGRKRKRKPPAAESFREERGDGWFRPHPLHPWLDAAVTGDPGHVPARRAVAVDGKERKLAKAGGKKKVHLLAAVTHVPGLVIAQDKVAKAGQGQRDQPLQAAAGAPAPGRCPDHGGRHAGEQGQRPVPARGRRRRTTCGQSSATSPA